MNHRAHGLARIARRTLVSALGALLTSATCASPVAASAASAPADPARVHVRGIARIDAHATKSAGAPARLVLAGRVTDDTAVHGDVPRDAAPSPAPLSLRIAQADGARPVTLASTSPDSCQGGAARPVLGSPEQLVLPTDAAGRFCVQVTLPVDRYMAHLDVPSSDRIDGASLDLSLDLALQPATLTLEGPAALSLDDETTSIEAKAREQDPMSGQSLAAHDLALTLWSEGSVIGDATTDPGGRAIFVVPSARLGPPGRGELRVSFAGNANAAPAAVARAVERRTGVHLELPDAVDGKLAEASGDDVEIRVVASPTCAARGCKAVPTGTIELRTSPGSGAVILGAAPLEAGAARVVGRFNPLEAPQDTAELTLRYVADSPWFEARGDRTVVVPLRPQGPWSTALLVATGTAVLIWLAVARFPFGKRLSAPAEPARSSAAREPAPRVELVRPGDAGRWVGRVLDAHDAAPIAQARVAIERPAFRDVQVIAEGTSDSTGAFAVRSDAVVAGDELVVESRIHAVVRRPVPAPGEIEVALVQRRRVLIDQLVAWAKRRGRPFDARPEPTPAHVGRAAARLEFALEQRAQAARIEQWAEAVEAAVYAGVPVDARAQAEVERLGPGDAARPGETPGAGPEGPEGPAAPKER